MMTNEEKKTDLLKRIRAAKDDALKQALRQELADLENEEKIDNEPGKYCTGWIGQRKC